MSSEVSPVPAATPGAALPRSRGHAYKLTLAYDGTPFHGWQRQPGVPTIQSELEAALVKVAQEPVEVVGSGRTDAGVHARGQVASVHLARPWLPIGLRRALNAVLPAEIRVLEVEPAPAGFDALVHAVGKHYCYQIDDGPVGNLFTRGYRWKLWSELEVPAMHAAAQHLVGTHDFAGFQSAGSPRLSTVRTLYSLQVSRGRGGDPHLVTLDVQGSGFLYQMVRGITGTLVEVGKGNRPPEWVKGVLAAKDRTVAGQNAPAHGLFLECAYYPSWQELELALAVRSDPSPKLASSASSTDPD